MIDRTGLFSQGIQAAFRHKTLLLVIFFSVLAVTGGVTALMPRQYESNMQIVVQDSREKPLEVADKSTSTGNQASSEELIESRVNSEMELLSASDVLEQAVTFRDDLARSGATPARGSFEMAQQLKKFGNRLKLTPVRKTTVLEVSYRDSSPELAQKVLDEIKRAYMDKHLRVLRPEGTLKLFADRAAFFNTQLMQGQQQLVDFQIANHVTSITLETDELNKQLDVVRADMLQEQAAVSASAAQVATLQRMLNGVGGSSPTVPRRIATSTRSASNFYATQQVESTLVELQNKRTQLLTRFQPKDLLVQEVEEQIANTQASLTRMKNEPNVEVTSDQNPVWNQLEQQLRGAEVAAASSQARLGALRGEATTIDSRLQHLQSITVDNDRMVRSLAELQDAEKLYSDKSEHERLEDVLDRTKVGNITVAMEPTISAYPVSPRTLLNYILGLITALVCCIATLVVLESTRSTILSADELESMFDLRVLSTIPEFSATPPSR